MIIESFGFFLKLLLLMQAFLCIFGISLLKEKNKCYIIELDKNQSYVKLDTHVYIVIRQNRRSQPPPPFHTHTHIKMNSEFKCM